VTLRADTTPSWSTSVTTAASLASVSVSQSGSGRPDVRRGIHVRAPGAKRLARGEVGQQGADGSDVGDGGHRA
jgi:hypothetical protein